MDNLLRKIKIEDIYYNTDSDNKIQFLVKTNDGFVNLSDKKVVVELKSNLKQLEILESGYKGIHFFFFGLKCANMPIAKDMAFSAYYKGYLRVKNLETLQNLENNLNEQEEIVL